MVLMQSACLTWFLYQMHSMLMFIATHIYSQRPEMIKTELNAKSMLMSELFFMSSLIYWRQIKFQQNTIRM